MSINSNPIVRWLQTTTFLFDLNSVRKAYEESYRLLPKDVQNKIEEEYLHDIYHSLDLLLCMMPYRDIQYGPKGKELKRRMKLGWIAYNINAVQKLLNNWYSVKRISKIGIVAGVIHIGMKVHLILLSIFYKVIYRLL